MVDVDVFVRHLQPFDRKAERDFAIVKLRRHAGQPGRRSRFPLPAQLPGQRVDFVHADLKAGVKGEFLNVIADGVCLVGGKGAANLIEQVQPRILRVDAHPLLFRVRL